MVKFSCKLLATLAFCVFCTDLYSQSIIHFQNWEGQPGAGNWLVETGGTNQWRRGTDGGGVSSGVKGIYISSDGSTFGYNSTVAEETYTYKDINFPSDASLDVEIKFDWKCVGEVGYDYMKVYIVDRSLTNLTESNIEAYGGFVYRLNSGNEFSNQASFTTYTETLPTTVEGRSDLRIVFTWTNDNNTTNGVPAAVDNIILSLGPVPSSLSGEYTIGQASGAYFPTITEATYFLNTFGVSSNVTFNLTDALYNSTTEAFPIIIDNFNTNPPSPESNSYTLTIKPDASVTTVISGAVAADAPVDGMYRGLFTLNEADNVVIDGSNNGTASRDLTINNTSTTQANTIFIASESPNFNDNITIKNTIIETADDAGNVYSGGILIMDKTYDNGAGGFSAITIDNNQFITGEYGIYIDGGSAGAINGSINTIANNDLEQSGTNAISRVGIYIRGVSSGTISGNAIGNFDDTANEQDVGISLGTGATNILLEKNEIYNIGYSGTGGYNGIGIRVASETTGAGSVIRNNVIYGIYGDGWDITSGYYDYNPYGILLSGTQSGIDIFNNSIYLNGTTLNQTDAISVGIGFGSGSTAEIKNNIIVNNLGLSGSTGIGSAGIFAQTASSQFEDINYNNYFVNASGSGTNYIGRIGSTNYATLASWQAASGSDASSITADPGYTSTSNLLPDATNPNAWYANGTGVQINTVTDDFIGTARSISVATGAPDMGAYEFTPSSTPPAAGVSGTHSNGGTETFTSGDRVIAEITWGASGTLPTVTALRYYSGVNPPSPAPGTAEYFNSYVDIETTGGSDYTYDLKLYYDEALIGTLSSESDIRLSKDDGSGWISFASNTPNTTDNNVTVTGLSSFSTFTGSDIDNLLPVQLIYFNGSAIDEHVVLTWKTASELNNDHFLIERSKDGRSWSTLGKVTGSGTTSSIKAYSFHDERPLAGRSYYRLKQIDFDGTYEYSDIIAIENSVNNVGIITLYPNPVNKGVLNIGFTTSDEKGILIEVLNHSGRILINKKAPATTGSNVVTLDISAFHPGLYLMRLTKENKTSVFQFAKE
ncbi:T9SS type A sorting domain-containing protein [Fulvivirga imtechensis]|nr:T9SS type A sorting domain-containing protein [Fulvivirga imtechensis]